jgi:exonuclease III
MTDGATYNVGSLNGRLPALLCRRAEARPDIVALQELKAQQHNLPERTVRKLGYDVIRHGLKCKNCVAILSRVDEIHEPRRSLPGASDATQHRCIEVAVDGILVAGRHLSKGHPRPRPKFDNKPARFERLIGHATHVLATGAPVVPLGDINAVSTERDVYEPERRLGARFSRRRSGTPSSACLTKAGLTLCDQLIQARRSIPLVIIPVRLCAERRPTDRSPAPRPGFDETARRCAGHPPCGWMGQAATTRRSGSSLRTSPHASG